MVLLSTTFCSAQRYEGITKTLSVRILQPQGWSSWTTPEIARLRLVVNVAKAKVIVYSKTPQVYTILYEEDHCYDITRNYRETRTSKERVR